MTASLLQPVAGPADGSSNLVDSPTCLVTGTTTNVGACAGPNGATRWLDSAFSSVGFGCGPYTIGAQGTQAAATYNLCTGLPMTGSGSQLAAAYVNAWVFQDASSGGYHLWQQDHVDPGSVLSCPDGLSPSGGSPGLTSGVYRAAVDTVALDGATGASIGGSFKTNAQPAGPLAVS